MSADAQRPRGGGGRRGAVRAFLVWWVLCAALWLVLVDRVPLAELVLGAVCVTIAAAAAVLVRGQRETILRPRARWLPRAARPLAALVTDVVPLARTLLLRGVLRRTGTGELVELPYDAAGDARERAAFRVLTAGLGSLGPNTIVAEVDAERGVVLAHQLEPTDDPASAALPLGEDGR